MGQYDWSVNARASIVSQNGSQATVRVQCYFKNNSWDYSMYCTGWTSCSVGGSVQVFGRANLDTQPSGINGETYVGQHDYVISKGHSSQTIKYAARIMSDGGYANGDKWSAEGSISVPAKSSYTVSYNANGGSGAPSSQTKWYGETLTLSGTKPTRTGYTFKGWATSSGGSVAYNSGASYTNNSGVTLYAVWQINTYTVTFKSGYGNNDTLKTQTVNYGSNATPPSASRTGYTFAGWSGTYTNVTSNRTITATWTINTWIVSYNANGGSGQPPSQTKTYGQNLTLSLTKPTRTGYTFLHWNTQANGSGTSYNAGASYTANAGATLYAQWRANILTVKFYSNYATESFSGAENAVSADKNVVVRTVQYTYATAYPDGLWNYSYKGASTYLGRTRYDATGYWCTTTAEDVKLEGNKDDVISYNGDIAIGEDKAFSSGQELAQTLGKTLANGDASINLYAHWVLLCSRIAVYLEDGRMVKGLTHIYDGSGERHYGIIYVYDSNGNRHEVV